MLILRDSQKPAALAKAWQNRRMAAWLRRAAPADGSGELARAPDEGESFFQRMMGKRKAEASPHVSPDKGAASERVDEAASYLESLAVGTSSDACGGSSGSSVEHRALVGLTLLGGQLLGGFTLRKQGDNRPQRRGGSGCWDGGVSWGWWRWGKEGG